MWSHYASSHKGFCIEFDFPENLQRGMKRVEYHKSIATIDAEKFWTEYDEKTQSRAPFEEWFKKMTWRPLITKLRPWICEAEMRIVASNQMIKDMRPEGDHGKKIAPYHPDWVRSVIFGVDTPSTVKDYITENMPVDTDFKKAVKTSTGISIKPL